MCGLEGVTFSGMKARLNLSNICVMSFLGFLVYSNVLLCLLCVLFCYVQRLTLLCWYISQSFCFLPNTRSDGCEK